MVPRPLVVLVLPALLPLALSCSPAAARRQAAAGRPQPERPISWYVLENGRFVEVPGDSLPSAPREAFRPWTLQERVSGFARAGGAVYAAVNGYGVARVDPQRFGYLYDRSLFRGRTLRALLPEPGALLCHVYRSTLLDDPQASLDIEAPNLVRLRPGAEGYQADFIRPPFQASAKGWQAVSVARAASGLLWLEWKRPAGDRVEFAYTTYDAATGDERRVSREEFRAAYGAVPLDGFAPRAGRALDLLVARIAAAARKGEYLHIGVSGPTASGHFVRLPPGSGEAARQVPVFAEGGRALALESDGTLLSAVDGAGEVRASRLPPLPAGFVYCDLFASAGSLIAAWEQVDFYRVGRAGLVVISEAYW